ncbi:TetR/AcrR family transcriptional regulator [Nocardioides alcanivorans]|uniref:TetR/AcrR family transcriptional regulator n=1 Tax=Nocardioides alcanivorans TaxID=2897352 RepID=UPI001F16024B|nr:TetR/AcrR family transcriptional regulator [Nocardioides alcanivorans]
MKDDAAGGPSDRGTIRSRYKAQTRRALAEAAVAEFEERGYVQAKIEDIARRAGTSRATFYVHYSGKAEVMENMWDLVRRELVVLYRKLVATETRDVRALADWLSDTYDFYTVNRQRLLAVHEAIAVEADLAEAYSERLANLADMVAPLVRPEFGDTPELARTRAAMLTIQHERVCFLWLLRGVPFERDEAAQTLAELWFEQIGTEPWVRT